MSYLLDTNVLSELRKRVPDTNVVSWIQSRPTATLHLSVLTLGELRKGIEAATEPVRRHALMDWLEVELPAWFGGRILLVDVAVADRWGRLLASLGRPVPTIDSLLAATALQHNLHMVRRNTRDFRYPGLNVIDPWQTPGSALPAP